MGGVKLSPQDVQVHIRISKVMKVRLMAEAARLGIPYTEVARVAMGLGLDHLSWIAMRMEDR